jgi:hypothetical protein
MEWSLRTLPNAVAIAICAEGSPGSGALSGFRRISSMDGRSRNSRRKSTSSVVAAGPTVPSRELSFDLCGSREESALLPTCEAAQDVQSNERMERFKELRGFHGLSFIE